LALLQHDQFSKKALAKNIKNDTEIYASQFNTIKIRLNKSEKTANICICKLCQYGNFKRLKTPIEKLIFERIGSQRGRQASITK
jgi:hypothetical protein